MAEVPPFPHLGYYLNCVSGSDADMALLMHKHLTESCGLVESVFYINGGKERFAALLDARGRYALLTNASFYKENSNMKTTTRMINESATTRPRYFLAQNYIRSAVHGFFAKDVHGGYSLIVDTVSRTHQACLVIEKHKPRQPYRFFAFDPNHNALPTSYSDLALKILDTNRFINQWTPKRDNKGGLCYAVTWRFIYLVIAEGYDPINQEHIHSVYDLVKQKSEIKPHVNGKTSAMNYRVRNGDEVAFVINDENENLIWTKSYILKENNNKK